MGYAFPDPNIYNLLKLLLFIGSCICLYIVCSDPNRSTCSSDFKCVYAVNRSLSVTCLVLRTFPSKLHSSSKRFASILTHI